MSTIHDDELILFHYRDGLAPERMAEIATALVMSAELARRYDALRQLLAAVDHDHAPALDARFEHQLWQRLQPRLAAGFQLTDEVPLADGHAAAPPVEHALRRGRWPRRRVAIAWGTALAAALALAVALPLGLSKPRRPHTSPAPRVVVEVARPAPIASGDAWQAASDRILVAQLSQHLHRTQGVLQSVAHAENDALLPQDDAYLRALAQDNRLLAAAADRRGIRALAGFLRSIDPVLLELANRSELAGADHDEDVRRFVRDGDLLFRIHAAHARLLAKGDLRA